MVDDILVQGVVLRQQDDGRFAAASPDAAAPLPGGHDGSRIAHQNAKVQAADVDPHFESAGGNDRGKLPTCQFLFDHPPLLRQKTGPIGTDPVGQLRCCAQDAHVDQFGNLARLGEGDGFESGFRRFR